MQELEARQANPELKELVVEASRVLARLDAARLEELALCCEALNRALEPMTKEEKREMARQAKEAAADMAVFARVLDATRANRNVMNRLRELHTKRLEYGERQARCGAGAGSPSTGGLKSRGRWGKSAEAEHGDH
ncbi:MAG: hypothetical protein WB341_16955 [Terracidiphilus sp.]